MCSFEEREYSMKFAKIPHYVKRVKELGPGKALQLVSNRMHTSFFEQYKRYQADRKKAALTWSSIAQKHKVCDFPCFLEILKKRSFSVAHTIYQKDFEDEKKLLARADEYAYNCFDILGSRDQCLMTMPWHADFRLQHQHADADYLFDKNIFYKDYVIQHGLTDRLVKDIKVPWELSRFDHLVVLGAAYQKTKDPLYSKAFVRQVTSWIDDNPYLLGPNWVCPMDVSLRALNWIWGFHYFKDVPEISEASWEKIITALYNHLVYLENNWETGIFTSNHYLSDLVGYFALTWLFTDMSGMKKKRERCYKQLLIEFEKQIFKEGTDYEGSTKYHALVTELFYHFYLLCQENYMPVPRHFVNHLKKMFSFIDWCTPEGGTLIAIGDDDSGKVIDGLTPSIINTMKEPQEGTEKHFSQFGLSLIKTKKWHVSLRHHVYHKQQPSGHFHNDMGSVTVAFNGVPIIVDPGSYVYTPSAVWRNRFRSIAAHSTFFIKNEEPVAFSPASLFLLSIPKRAASTPFISEHSLFGPTARREVRLDEKKNQLLVLDSWSGSDKKKTTVWNFTLAPHIVPYRNDGKWDLFYQDKLIAKLYSKELLFDQASGWYAPNYGTKIACKKLVAERSCSDAPVAIYIEAVIK